MQCYKNVVRGKKVTETIFHDFLSKVTKINREIIKFLANKIGHPLPDFS